jgi:hypothetical protein
MSWPFITSSNVTRTRYFKEAIHEYLARRVIQWSVKMIPRMVVKVG